MKKFLYTTLMVVVALTAVVSCGKSGKVIKTLSTQDSYVQGDHDWFVELTDDECDISLLPTDCDTLFNVATTVTLELAVSANKMPEFLVAEYKEAELFLFNTKKVGFLVPTAEGFEQISKFLKGKVGSEIDVTFVSKEALPMSVIESDIKDVNDFRIWGLDFTEQGKVNKKELFRFLFNDAAIDEVITKFETSIIELKKALNAYLDTESDKDYAKLEKHYLEADLTVKMLEATIDEDDITRSQYNRLSDIYEVIEEAEDELY